MQVVLYDGHKTVAVAVATATTGCTVVHYQKMQWVTVNDNDYLLNEGQTDSGN